MLLTKSMQPSKSAGFTLIEIMIVVAILGIVSAIAFPSYQEYVRKTRRADAQTALMELGHFMERNYTANGTYLVANAAPALPFTEAPKDAGGKVYDLSLTGTTATGYTLQAVPKGAMSTDVCGTLTLSNTGAKGQASGQTQATCWRR